MIRAPKESFIINEILKMQLISPICSKTKGWLYAIIVIVIWSARFVFDDDVTSLLCFVGSSKTKFECVDVKLAIVRNLLFFDWNWDWREARSKFIIVIIIIQNKKQSIIDCRTITPCPITIMFCWFVLKQLLLLFVKTNSFVSLCHFSRLFRLDLLARSCHLQTSNMSET